MADINQAYRKINHNLVGLYAFEIVAQHGNFTSAAEVLGLTQPAISQRIKGLEAELGVVLFKRQHRGVVLTNEGFRLLNAISPAMKQIGSSVTTLLERKLKPRVRLSADFAFSTFWLLPRLPHLRSELGDEIEIQLLASQIPPEEDEEEFDINIHVRSWENSTDTEALLIQEKVVAVCSPDFLEVNGPISSSEELLDSQLLSLSKPPSAEWITWWGWFESLGIEGERLCNYNSFNNYDMIIQAAVSGQGIALGWLGLIDHLIQDGQLVQVTEDIVTSNAGYVMSRNPNTITKGPDHVFDWVMNQLPDAINPR
ncbi:LysR family transcriptional regulator [Kiloniella majae]|uniref:LysR family transcriptional regulator n=1 Tax=Kiloniella majae TaxID=1938558 RepID=UPI000A2788B7|nr:LysR family transcriptional regulator [Kiloniella majae]